MSITEVPQPEQYVVAGVPAYETTEKFLFYLNHREGIDRVDMCELKPLSQARTGLLSVGANPCIAFAAIMENKDIWIGHSRSVLTSGQLGIIQTARSGIVGGGNCLLDYYGTLFQRYSFQIVPPLPEYEYWYFCIAAIRDNSSGILSGIYFKNIPF